MTNNVKIVKDLILGSKLGIEDSAGNINYGTDGQVLTSGGNGNDPKWTDMSSGSGIGSGDDIWKINDITNYGNYIVKNPIGNINHGVTVNSLATDYPTLPKVLQALLNIGKVDIKPISYSVNSSANIHNFTNNSVKFGSDYSAFDVEITLRFDRDVVINAYDSTGTTPLNDIRAYNAPENVTIKPLSSSNESHITNLEITETTINISSSSQTYNGSQYENYNYTIPNVNSNKFDKNNKWIYQFRFDIPASITQTSTIDVYNNTPHNNNGVANTFPKISSYLERTGAILVYKPVFIEQDINQTATIVELSSNTTTRAATNHSNNNTTRLYHNNRVIHINGYAISNKQRNLYIPFTITTIDIGYYDTRKLKVEVFDDVLNKSYIDDSDYIVHKITNFDLSDDGTDYKSYLRIEYDSTKVRSEVDIKLTYED